MNDLTLVSEEDLIQELFSRNDHSVFMAIKITKETTEASDIINLRRWKGNTYTCVGLCDSLSKSILNEYESKEKEIGEF